MKVYKQKDKIIFEFPAEQPRYNPYMGDDPVGTHPTFTGIIVPQKNSTELEIGFACVIDMDYKGKEDQWSDIQVHWDGDKDSFIKKCEELGMSWFEYRRCAKCRGPIYGAAVSSKELDEKYGGPVCHITCDDE